MGKMSLAYINPAKSPFLWVVVSALLNLYPWLAEVDFFDRHILFFDLLWVILSTGVPVVVPVLTFARLAAASQENQLSSLTSQPRHPLKVFWVSLVGVTLGSFLLLLAAPFLVPVSLRLVPPSLIVTTLIGAAALVIAVKRRSLAGLPILTRYGVVLGILSGGAAFNFLGFGGGSFLFYLGCC